MCLSSTFTFHSTLHRTVHPHWTGDWKDPVPTVCPLLHSCSRRRTQAIYAFCPPTDPLYLILIKRGPSRTPARDRLTVVASHTTSTLPLLK
ncbi:hypothetical protein HYQ45_003802 [Verticillium longisporum]|uniref:Uncharacterized protein n=1 Tax=Verticillium longisporum TaxID=100787 RepID=A0A8I2ZWK7_VERLO|nr:hypothetical protein HYQ45_003802 [Verticillium longisporum]